ncbi:MAG TPA: phenylalanine--tRNA ligase subunit beta [Gaiellales bacterium]|jgi:phenylalanyl-tRNA synthetase beta chain
MRVPVSWLREYVSFDLPPRELGERLSLTGTKLEALHRRGVGNADRYRVGRVLTRDRHPNADRLSLCTVDIGAGEPQQIVCGASNFDAGATVAVALPGAVLPDGTELRVAKLRGLESHGMMLSERELELGQEHDGIMLLPADWPVGDALLEHLAIADDVLEFEITSNRPDCQNVYGIAREVSAVLDTDLAPWPGTEPEAAGAGTVDDYVKARIDAPEMCPRWAARVFTDVKVRPSPAWLKARIAAAGMRPISNVVDITNYVMLAIGEPTHAFDLDKVSGREIIVRRATAGEPVTTLDGQARTLDTATLVIADADKPSAVAGLMGSEWSEVGAGTTTVLMECANFDGPTTQASSIRLGLRTEGSSRWEKGLDPYLPAQALALASQLMVELAGAKLVPGMIDLHGDLPEAPVVPLRRERLESLIGVAYADTEVDRALGRLGYEWEGTGWRVPTWRAADTTREVDLIEEVARIAGLERVPVAMPGGAPGGGRLNPEERLRRMVVDVLRGAGLSEAATLTLWDTGVPDLLRLGPDDPRRALVELMNPMSADWAAMRTLVFPGLLHSARRNLAMSVPRVALFEIGHVFLPGAGQLPDQPGRVAGVLAGEGAGFFEVKGVVEALAAAARVAQPEFRPAAEPFLHPGRAAAVADGFVGELHPQVAEAFGLDGGAAVFELGLDVLRGPPPEEVLYRDVISFPPLRQDIAVVVGEDVPAGRVIEVVRAAAGPELAGVDVFDVYRGVQVGEGRKSLALHLVFQAADRTLTDAEVDAIRARVVAALQAAVGGELRA